jgi:hypothetical protein
MPAVGYLDEVRVNNRTKEHRLSITDVTQTIELSTKCTKRAYFYGFLGNNFLMNKSIASHKANLNLVLLSCP